MERKFHDPPLIYISLICLVIIIHIYYKLNTDSFTRIVKRIFGLSYHPIVRRFSKLFLSHSKTRNKIFYLVSRIDVIKYKSIFTSGCQDPWLWRTTTLRPATSSWSTQNNFFFKLIYCLSFLSSSFFDVLSYSSVFDFSFSFKCLFFFIL